MNALVSHKMAVSLCYLVGKIYLHVCASDLTCKSQHATRNLCYAPMRGNLAGWRLYNECTCFPQDGSMKCHNDTSLTSRFLKPATLVSYNAILLRLLRVTVPLRGLWGYSWHYCGRSYLTCSSLQIITLVVPSKVLHLAVATAVLGYMRPT